MRQSPFLLPACLLAACGGSDTGAAAGPSVRDSAGISLVENVSPRWGEGQGWKVADSARLDVGGGDDLVANFTGFAQAYRLSDGRIAVVESQGSVIKFIDTAGAVRAIGRQGGGPGEFEFLIWAGRLPGDSLVTFEAGNRRFQTFAPDGSFVRNVTFQAEVDDQFPVPPIPVGVFADGTVLTQRSSKPPFPFEGPEGSIKRDSVLLVRYTQEGKPVDSLGIWPSTEMFGTTMQMGPQSMRVPMARPFSPQLQAAVARDTIYVATGDAWEVRVLAADGRTVRIIRRGGERLAVTPEMIAEWQEEFLGAADQIRQMPAAMLEQMKAAMASAPFPDRLAAHGRVLVSDDGHLWVQEARGTSITGLGGSRIWSVIAPDGSWLGDVTAPEGVTVQAVGDGWLVGQKDDEDGAPHVLLYDVERGA